MIIEWMALGGISLACMAFGAVTGVIIDRWVREGERIDADPYNRHVPRHAASQRRTAPDRVSLVRDGDPSPRPAQRPAEGGTEPSDWYQAIARDHVSAANIAPVILPAPGEYRPQAGRDSGPGTDTMPRIGSTTGELIKLAGGAEQFRQQLSADNAAWLEEWSTPA